MQWKRDTEEDLRVYGKRRVGFRVEGNGRVYKQVYVGDKDNVEPLPLRPDS